MNDPRVIATIVVRLIGLVVLAFGVGSAAGALANYLPVFLPAIANISTPRAQLFGITLILASTLVTPLIGLYLLFGGKWMITRITRGLDPRSCPSCGYDVASLNADQCPECNSKLLRRA